MATITRSYITIREKNIIHFHETTENKQYDFNVNTGVLIGASGNPLKTFPAGMGKYLDNYHGTDLVIHLMRRMRTNPREYHMTNDYYTLRYVSCYQNVANLLTVMDKAQSLGVTAHNCRYDSFYYDELMDVDAHFKDFAKYCREHENPTIHDYYRNGSKERFIRDNRLREAGFDDGLIDELFDRRENIDDATMKALVHYLPRGVAEFCGTYDAIRKVREYLQYCNLLGIKPEKDNFFRSYINVKRAYLRQKQEIDTKALAQNYEMKKDALYFEDDNFITLFPKTAQDFEKEGRDQHNCVGGYADRVIKGETYVVFIRHKDNPNASYITCEVRHGTIAQFYEKYNTRPSDVTAIDFQNAYQTHLRQMWNN